MDYTEVKIFNKPELNEILIAWLAEGDFEMFEERADGLNAFIPAGKFDETSLKDLVKSLEPADNIRYEISLIRDQNWNKTWEANFEAVQIDERVHIRAPFHPSTSAEIEIVIEPKMSFGTGHHATTSEVIRLMLELDFRNKRVLDMGCGSGILAILASRLGAENIVAIDNDEWAVMNSIENCQSNNCPEIEVLKGDARLLENMNSFDIILANINRNILLNDMSAYSRDLVDGGYLVLSGYLESDDSLIIDKAGSCGLRHLKSNSSQNWVAGLFIKD